MRQIVLLVVMLVLSFKLSAQGYEFRKNIDKDSLFTVSVSRLSEGEQKKYKEMYRKGNEQEKIFLIFMISMPESSKKALIENYEKRKDEILELKEAYSELVPDNYFVYVEFKPESKILVIPEQISLEIYKLKNDDKELVSQNWNLDPDSKELNEIIASIGWTRKTLSQIKELLNKANCISIEKGKTITVGFAKSGTGKYSYKIFGKALTENQKQKYNNVCKYIYYKDNIVLEYTGGTVGPQCFEKD